jgi:ATP-dependent DNA helicase PIF1
MLTPKKPEPPKPRTKRAFLPWSQNQQAANTSEVEDRIEEEEEEEKTARPRKKQSMGPKAEVTATPKPKAAYAWNTTASALKLQQKNFREQNKKAAKENDTSVDDLKQAVNKRKKNAVARIFLSEEQQHVLSLVTEHKKSVFFTGSAGKLTIQHHVNINLMF